MSIYAYQFKSKLSTKNCHKITIYSYFWGCEIAFQSVSIETRLSTTKTHFSAGHFIFMRPFLGGGGVIMAIVLVITKIECCFGFQQVFFSIVACKGGFNNSCVNISVSVKQSIKPANTSFLVLIWYTLFKCNLVLFLIKIPEDLLTKFLTFKGHILSFYYYY